MRAAFNPPLVWLKAVATEVADDDPVLMALDEGEKPSSLHRANLDLSHGMLRELGERAARLDVSWREVIKALLVPSRKTCSRPQFAELPQNNLSSADGPYNPGTGIFKSRR